MFTRLPLSPFLLGHGQYEDEDKAAQREISRTVNLEHQEKIRGQRERRERWLQRSHEKKDFIIKWERQDIVCILYSIGMSSIAPICDLVYRRPHGD